MSFLVDLFINGDNVGARMEWKAQFEEVLGGQGRGTVTVDDPTFTYEPQCHWDVKAVLHDSGWVLFRGEIISPPVALVDGEELVRWALQVVDYSYELDWRLVGAIDGTTWIDEDGYGDFIAIDPYANSLADDAQTMQALYDHYIRVAGEAINTTTYVTVNLAPGTFAAIFWNYATLREASDDVAALVSNNLQYWWDPDLNLHWTPIPAWQELAAAPDTTIFPGLAGTALTSAPANINNDSDEGGAIGCSGLSWVPDGSNMPEQEYVKGGTGFSYSDGVGQFSTGDAGPVAPPAAKYQVTINEDTNLYSADSTGYILDDLTPPVIPAGQVVFADVVVFPRKPTGEHHGGSFYKVASGPYAGGYISSSTNGLGYGDITAIVAPVPPPAGPPPDPVPVTGIGGSGWTNSVTQDPNKRQQYFDAPLSVDKAGRDAIGGQQLYRAKGPTLRGSFLLTSAYGQEVDGWRVGQIFTLTDHRLPASMNGRKFLIQKVTPMIDEGAIVRYQIDFGDGPMQRAAGSPKPRPRVPEPAVQLLITAPDLGPNPHDSQVIMAQLVDRSNNAPWKIPGKIVQWSLTVVDKFGNPVSGQGSIDPMVSTTDRSGAARTTLTAGSRTGLRYSVVGDIPVS